MANVEQTKELLDFALTFGNALGVALEDGFQVSDLLTLMPSFVKLPKAIEGSGEIPTELKDLDDAEVAEIRDFIRQKFDIPDDKLEEVIERALALGLEIIAFVYFVMLTKGKASE